MKLAVFEGDINQCYGCGACQQICPFSAIKMVKNVEGFLFPYLDTNICVECKLCEKVCPVITDNLQKVVYEPSIEVYAAWNNDLSQIMTSSSGAIFPLLAEKIIEKKGIVYGCAWSKRAIIAEHIRVDNVEELTRLKGSRYVQSNINNTFSQVALDLKNGLKVLFSGTPCQIAGLKLFLRKEYENLYTVDVVCHGVPSSKMLDYYVGYLEKRENQPILNLKFRDKRKSGWAPWVSWNNGQINGDKKYKLATSEPYLFGFYAGYFNRESCYRCKFSAPNRAGDITLADYWGVELSHPELEKYHKYGISLVICNSDQGRSLFKDIAENITKVESTFENASKRNSNLIRVRERPQQRNTIYKHIEEYGFAVVAKSTLRPRLFILYQIMPEWALTFLRKIKRILR